MIRSNWIPHWPRHPARNCLIFAKRPARCGRWPRNRSDRMKNRTVLFAGSFLLLLSIAARADTKRPSEVRNAALRYWLAFAEMQDQSVDKKTAELLEKTAAGEVPWNETALGPILDRNQQAILALQRASRLPECDWGLEYDQGPNASVAYAPRARVLARLNTLYGM